MDVCEIKTHTHSQLLTLYFEKTLSMSLNIHIHATDCVWVTTKNTTEFSGNFFLSENAKTEVKVLLPVWFKVTHHLAGSCLTRDSPSITPN